MNRLAIFMIGIYRTFLVAHMGGACRFEPSCSEYALTAYQTLPFARATQLVVKRVLSCRPGGKWGLDPLPMEERRT